MYRIPQQLLPLTALLILILGALITARLLLVPDTFGDYGHYRADAVNEVAALEITYAGQEVCSECHDDIFETKRESHHRGVSCEVCHGPAVDHAEAPDEITPSAPRGRGYCPLCHGYNPARPSGFPQINPERHNPGKPCMTCHDPHSTGSGLIEEELTPSHGKFLRPTGSKSLCADCHGIESLWRFLYYHKDRNIKTF